MKYKKPKIIAKHVAGKVFVASCPVKGPLAYCTKLNVACMVGNLK